MPNPMAGQEALDEFLQADRDVGAELTRGSHRRERLRDLGSDRR